MSVVAPPRWEVVYAEAHAERFRYLAGSGAEFLRRPGVLAVRTGADSNVDNGIVLEREDADVEGLIDWFGEPASLICSGFEAPRRAARAPRARSACARRRPGSRRGPFSATCPRSRLRPASRSRRTTSRGRCRSGTGLARRDGRRVGDASAFFTSSTVLLEHVEVAEEERRRGIGTALALARLHEGRRLGCELAVFGTTPESAALYEQFGFTHAARRGPALVLPAARAVTTDHFAGRVAERYDETSQDMFAPEVLDPAVDFLAELAGRGPALELGIGTGRVALPLARRGIRIAGIDLSPDMVAQLRAKPGAEDIEVTVGDIATTRVEGTFALVYVVWNTINNLVTQEAQAACFRNAAAHLEPGGCFVVEVGVPPGKPLTVFDLSDTHAGIDEYDADTQRLVSHHFTLLDGRWERLSVPFRAVWPAELDLMARLAGHGAARALGRLEPRAVQE